MTEKDIEKMFEECGGFDTASLNKDDILAKAKQELYFGSEASESEKKKSSFGLFFSKKRFIPIVAGAALALTLCFGMIGLYNENFQTVYIDINPSVALKLNRFERVIGVEFLNNDAAVLLSNTKLVGCDASEAVETVISACTTAGYVQNDSQIYISATSKEEKDAEKLLQKIKGRAETMNNNNSETYSVNTYNAKKDEKKNVESSSLSPAKYKLINEILEENAGYTFDQLKVMSMSELHRILSELDEDFEDLNDRDDDHGYREEEKDPYDDDDDDDDRDEKEHRKEDINKIPPEDNKGDDDDRGHGEDKKRKEYDD